jgi:F0F1-type ATP synthase assembly protein I
VTLALLSSIFTGMPGAVSSALGGAINVLAGLVLFAVASLGRKKTAGEVVLRAIKAEGSKVVFVVIALWMSMARFKGLVHVPFIATFCLTALLPVVAFLGRDADEVSTDPVSTDHK